MPIKQDWAAVGAGIESGLKAVLNEMIDGAISDLDGPIRETAARLSLAAKRGRMDLVEESRDQLVLLMMEKRMRMQSSVAGIFDRVLLMGMNALVNGAIAGLAGLKAV